MNEDLPPIYGPTETQPRPLTVDELLDYMDELIAERIKWEAAQMDAAGRLPVVHALIASTARELARRLRGDA